MKKYKKKIPGIIVVVCDCFKESTLSYHLIFVSDEKKTIVVSDQTKWTEKVKVYGRRGVENFLSRWRAWSFCTDGSYMWMKWDEISSKHSCIHKLLFWNCPIPSSTLIYNFEKLSFAFRIRKHREYKMPEFEFFFAPYLSYNIIDINFKTLNPDTL